MVGCGKFGCSMSVEAGRRTFVRNLVVGVPALAGAATFSPTAQAFPAFPAFPIDLAPGAQAVGAGIERVLQQMAGLHADLVDRRPTAADLRTAAGYLRELIAYRQESNRDAELASVVRGLISTHGRDALATVEPNLEIVHTGLARYGVDPGRVTLGSPSPEIRAAALETLARRGATVYYIEHLIMFETLAHMIDENPDSCHELRELANVIEAAMAVLCAAAQLFPPVVPECIAVSLILAVIKVMEVLQGC